ncbi:MAG: glycosyltransferase family 9 protein [Fimbriimonadaceae bacterium]
MRFLISRLSALGDVVCTLPAAGALRAAFPDCEIVWIVDKRFAGVTRCCKHLNQVILRDEMVEGEFDCAFDMQGLFKSGSILRKVKARQKLGYHWQREGASLFSAKVLPDPTSYHIVDQYVDVTRVLCPAIESADFGLEARPEDVLSLSEKFDLNSRYVVINPGAGWVSKRWPPSHFAELCNWISSQNMEPVAIGGNSADDHAGFEEVQAVAKCEIKKLTGNTSIPELIALIYRAQAHVGGDTGSTHIAAAVATRAIGLYSITRPQRSCPYGQVENCLYNPDGLGHISPEEVIAVLDRELNRP